MWIERIVLRILVNSIWVGIQRNDKSGHYYTTKHDKKKRKEERSDQIYRREKRRRERRGKRKTPKSSRKKYPSIPTATTGYPTDPWVKQIDI